MRRRKVAENSEKGFKMKPYLPLKKSFIFFIYIYIKWFGLGQFGSLGPWPCTKLGLCDPAHLLATAGWSFSPFSVRLIGLGWKCAPLLSTLKLKCSFAGAYIVVSGGGHWPLHFGNFPSQQLDTCTEQRLGSWSSSLGRAWEERDKRKGR